MSRLKSGYPNLYDADPNYITMLVKNFRNAPAILHLANEMFYQGSLQVCCSIIPAICTTVKHGLPRRMRGLKP